MQPNILHICTGEHTKYEIHLFAVICGKDISVTICGGSPLHIGAASVAAGRHYDGLPLRYSASASSIVLPDHKDDVISKEAAAMFADALHVTAVVSAGLHIDNATANDIKQLTDNAMEACRQLISKVTVQT